MMPKIAEGDANKVWVIPSEITKALEGLGSSIHEIAGIPRESGGPLKRVDMGPSEPQLPRRSEDRELSRASAAVEAAIEEARSAANPVNPANRGKASADAEAPRTTPPEDAPGA
jgi:hypothetical protein